jgi:RNA polymerase sigma-70 factor (ECF subfamily)
MSKAAESSQAVSLELLQAGDRVEFARFVEATSPAIYRIALRILNDPQDAEDALQETYLKAMRALSNFEGRSSLTTWLYRIAVNEALMMVRKRRPEVPVEDEPDEEDEDAGHAMQIVDWCCLPESELVSVEAKNFINKAIDRLPEKLRTVFVLRDVEGLSIKETADVLELTEMNVKTRLLRARLKMRAALSGYYGERMQEGLNQ